MEAAIPNQDKNIFMISLVLLALSIFDAFMTLWGIDLGAIEEVNPIMNQITYKHTLVPVNQNCAAICFVGSAGREGILFALNL